MTLRPDHGAAIRWMRAKLNIGQWGVVARQIDEASAERVRYPRERRRHSGALPVLRHGSAPTTECGRSGA